MDSETENEPKRRRRKKYMTIKYVYKLTKGQDSFLQPIW